MTYDQFTKYVDKLRSFGFDVYRNKKKSSNYAVFTDGVNIGGIYESGYNQNAVKIATKHKHCYEYGGGFVCYDEVTFSELTKEIAQEAFHKVPKNYFGPVDNSKVIKYSSFDEWIEKSGSAELYDIPLYVYATIVWNDLPEKPKNVIIKIGKTSPKEDDNFFYEAECIDEIKKLTKKDNGEDFRLLKYHISYRLQPVTQYVKEESSSIIRLELCEKDLEFLSEVFHEYKDCHRGEKEAVLRAMELENKFARQTNSKYVSDTTYDIKEAK